MTFTEDELELKYKQYLQDWDYSHGDGPYKYEYWKKDYLSKRTSTSR